MLPCERQRPPRHRLGFQRIHSAAPVER
jgi:hypothetical protein